ncbi:MerR family transcriptional regulator [Amycolatopsis antarctica]|uniref:MerR family transcriptional regulator n=2 Tax=Amycolatopsis antarctica TaxID=1854586 RepID=A0A263D0N1_9PSEU|nr:MerR family transcriptional regulator [Amycolatopsis antarctica]
MVWSIREIAELAETSQRAVRHYNEIGLLEPPARTANGHKRYGENHLARLLRIKRLTELGLSLSRISVLDALGDRPEEARRFLDAELTGTMDRLRRVQAEVTTILRERVPIELPSGFAPATVGRQLNHADRSFLVVMSRVLGVERRRAYADLLREQATDPAGLEFTGLDADADDRTCRDLAERMVPAVHGIHIRHPALRDLHAGAPFGSDRSKSATEAAKRELYNPAQQDVMRRLHILLPRTANSVAGG